MQTRCFITQPIHADGIAMLEAAGIAIRHASSPDMATLSREIGNATAVITQDAGLAGAVMFAAPALRMIASCSASVENIDLAQARARRITVTHTPGTTARSVAEYTIGLILTLARRIDTDEDACRTGPVAFTSLPMELHGRRLGLAGFGPIARQVASIARNGFGMVVSAWSPHSPDDLLNAHAVSRAPYLDALLSASDVLSFHRPSCGDPIGMIDAESLRHIKPGALLIHTGQASLIDIRALRAALEDGRIAAAALDVVTSAALPLISPIRQLPRTLLTPRLGGITNASQSATARLCAAQVIAAARGQIPSHIVSLPRAPVLTAVPS